MSWGGVLWPPYNIEENKRMYKRNDGQRMGSGARVACSRHSDDGEQHKEKLQCKQVLKQVDWQSLFLFFFFPAHNVFRLCASFRGFAQ